LIVPPLPAVSRPSNTMQTFALVALTHSCMATSSACSLASSDSYALRPSFFPAADCSLFGFFLDTSSAPSGTVALLHVQPDAHEPTPTPVRPGLSARATSRSTAAVMRRRR